MSILGTIPNAGLSGANDPASLDPGGSNTRVRNFDDVFGHKLGKGVLKPARKWARTGFLSMAALCLHAFQVAAAERSLPEFKLRLLDGRVVDSKNLRGRVTVIDFWATWCKPCIAEIPEYNRFYQEYSKKGVVLIAVASDSGTEAEVREAAKRLKMEYPVAAPALKDLDRLGEFEVLPTTWVFDARGKLVKEFLGASPDKHRTLRSLVDDLLTHAHAPDRSPRKNKVH